MARYRMLVISIVMLVFFVSISSSYAVTLNVSTMKEDATLEELLFIGAASLFFDVDLEVSTRYYNEMNSLSLSLSLLYFSAETETEPDEIIAEKKKGARWGDVYEKKIPPGLAKQGKIPPGLAKKWDVDDDFFSKDDTDIEETMTIRFLSSYYGISGNEIYFFMDEGLSLYDSVIVLNVSAHGDIDTKILVKDRVRGLSWKAVSVLNQIPWRYFKEPAEPKEEYDKAIPLSGKFKDHPVH